MDTKELAAKCMKDHIKPLNKIELPTNKFFLDSPSSHQVDTEKYRNILKESLDYVRVDRRCARSKGIWMEDAQLCKVTKLVGPLLKNFGFQDKTGIYFLPEETLFLIEQNRLEMTFMNNQITISEAYDLLIQNNYNLNKYRIYKKLVHQGFKLLNTDAIRKFYLMNDQIGKNKGKKRKNDVNDEDDTLKMRRSNEEICINFNDEYEMNHASKNSKVNFNEIFKTLQQKCPKKVTSEELSKPPDYFGFLPSSTVTHKHEFNLYIREKINLNDLGNFEDVPNILAISTNDNIAFYRFPNVNIPNIS